MHSINTTSQSGGTNYKQFFPLYTENAAEQTNKKKTSPADYAFCAIMNRKSSTVINLSAFSIT